MFRMVLITYVFRLGIEEVGRMEIPLKEFGVPVSTLMVSEVPKFAELKKLC